MIIFFFMAFPHFVEFSANNQPDYVLLTTSYRLLKGGQAGLRQARQCSLISYICNIHPGSGWVPLPIIPCFVSASMTKPMKSDLDSRLSRMEAVEAVIVCVLFIAAALLMIL